MEPMELGYEDAMMVGAGQGVMSSGLEAVLGVFMVLILATSLLMLVSWWRIFQKAKLPGRGAIIPFYNIYLILKLAGKPNWTWWLLFPPVLWILMIVAQFKIAEKFGKGTGFALGLWFLPVIFYPILAFSKDVEYHAEA